MPGCGPSAWPPAARSAAWRLSEWQALSQKEREHLRGKATVQLFGLGVHSVIDHLGELDTCLADISLRRLKGEKP